jgi:hypothetical protein
VVRRAQRQQGHLQRRPAQQRSTSNRKGCNCLASLLSNSLFLSRWHGPNNFTAMMKLFSKQQGRLVADYIIEHMEGAKSAGLYTKEEA